MYSKFRMAIALLTMVLFLVTTNVNAETAYASSSNLQAGNLTELEETLQSELAKKPESIIITYTSRESKDSASYIQGIKNAISHTQSSLEEELFWNMKSLSYKMKGSIGNITITLKPEYLTTIEQDNFVNKEIDRILGEILTTEMTPFEKEAAIHDYVVSHTSYEDLDEIGHTAYSALYNKKAVCQGYAILTNLLLKKVGIDSKLVVGYLNDDPAQSHMWNVVNIEDNWHMLDTVFDDPAPDKPGVQSTDYFNITNESLLSLGHTWVESDYPVADKLYIK
ncbi:transglutaminase domain-containing protein [Paenibacillus andongensis]|uniref:transglutaminase domain-containing protein n=1 Tax=Paenibacillus andongensis TaxID=2975482 RepID=UPI0021BB9227|nr:transglutaminase domain-containing protein [Paenibacillus andongensis]